MNSKFDLVHLVMRRLVQIFPWISPVYTEQSKTRVASKSIFIRHVDCGSTNAAEQEILALFNPYYDLEHYGIHLVASPRHADLLLITGPLTHAMVAALLAAFNAMPEPKRVITVGDGFDNAGVFANSYAVTPLPDEILAARIGHIPGSPPLPQSLLDFLIKMDDITKN